MIFMDIVEFAERVLGIELLECQKEILRGVEKLPRDTKLVMGRRGLIIMVPKTEGEKKE